jgi:hypothetical protein
VSEEKTLYALAKGEYSDYQVLAVFDSEETANEVASLANAGETIDPYDVEEISYYEHGTKPERTSRYEARTFVNSDGTLTHEGTTLRTVWPWDFQYPELGKTIVIDFVSEHRVVSAHRSKAMAEKRASDKAAKIAAELIEKKEEN